MKKRNSFRKRRIMKKKRPLEKIIILSLMISPIVLGGVLLPEQQATQATEADGKWEARSIEQIKKDVEGKKEYTIVWGDTLSGISLATNVTMEKLASLNGIGDYNLIYAGNKLVFEGNVVTVQDQNGVVTDQQQITESDKIVPNQPIGESVGQVSPTPNMSNTQDQTNVESSDTASIPSSNGENKNDGTTGNGSSSDGTNNGGVVTNPTPTPTPPDPDPAPTPTPEPEVHYTVWFYAYEGDDQSRNIEKGSRLFSTEEDATTFIDGYADSLLMEGIAGSYGVMSWE
jgi:hypothetical protein